MIIGSEDREAICCHVLYVCLCVCVFAMCSVSCIFVMFVFVRDLETRMCSCYYATSRCVAKIRDNAAQSQNHHQLMDNMCRTWSGHCLD